MAISKPKPKVTKATSSQTITAKGSTNSGSAGRKRSASRKSTTLTTAPDQRSIGGETHQRSTAETQILTTAQGVQVTDGQNSLKVGDRGPVTLSDFQLREKIFHFDHERIPERVVHARGYGAHGYFESYGGAEDLSCADVLARAGERTPAFVRFSTVAGSQGSADLARDVRGFAVKLYTKEGNWDIVGNNIPVFFIQDAIKFPDLIHAAKSEPDRGFPQAATAHDNFWDFASLMPEATHMLMWAMSDRTIPRSFRFMEGFGVHTFRMVNSSGESHFVKFHWKPKSGLQSVLWPEAVAINGADPDFHRRDLWNAIGAGDFPEWELGVQVFNDEWANTFDFDVLDPTKLIPEELLPVRPLGRLVLDRVVDNFFAETEQVAFCTQNIVRGIDFSNDPLLAGRNFSYLDTQLKRLGSPNFTHLPINAPKCPFANFQQDGHMAVTYRTGQTNYEPNSREGDERGPRETLVKGFAECPAAENGPQRRARPELFADHFSQARQFLLSQEPLERAHMADAFVFELSKVQTEAVRLRMVSNLRNVDETFAASVATGLGITQLPHASIPAATINTQLPSVPSLSIMSNPPADFAGRRVGVLVANGTPADVLARLLEQLASARVTVECVAPSINGIVDSNGKPIEVAHAVSGAPSVLFDAIAVLAGTEQSPIDAATKDWIRDAHTHCKVIGHINAAAVLFEAAGVQPDAGYVLLDRKSSGFVARCAAGREWSRDESATRHPTLMADRR